MRTKGAVVAVEAYRGAEGVLDEVVEACHLAVRKLVDGAVVPFEVPIMIFDEQMKLVAALDDALTSSPDPRDDPGSLIARSATEMERLRSLVLQTADVPELAVQICDMVLHWIDRRQRKSDQLLRAMAVVSAWDDRTPALAPTRVRRSAMEEVTQVLAIPLEGQFPVRMVRAGMRAFGPRWAIDLAELYLREHFSDPAYWDAVVVAMDELAAWATATDPDGIPDEFRHRAVSALVSITGYPELTGHAVMRIPLHRVTSEDRKELAELLADRNEVMPVDWLSEPDQLDTLAVEVAYLRALDAVEPSWPGATDRA